MRRLPDTELPTFACSRKEWNARRAAGAVAAIEAVRGWPPTVQEVAARLGYRSSYTAVHYLRAAVDLGLVVHDFTNRSGNGVGYRTARAA